MKLEWMANPRKGQRVQCSGCHKAIEAELALADVAAEAGTFYHTFCVPPGTRLPGLTPGMVRAARMSYPTPRQWDAYIDIAERGHEGAVTDREVDTVTAHSRSEAFDRLNEVEVVYGKLHPGKVVVGRGVSHMPRLTK